MAQRQIKLESGWKNALHSEFNADYMESLRQFLLQQNETGRTIYPKGSEYFNALNLTPIEQVKVVILGQDPYHGPNQAHGLSFSVPKGVPFPPSLRNIFQEIQQDLGLPKPSHGCLTHWAEQGVLLLNSVLTVEQGKAASHQGKGWEQFTDAIIQVLNEQRDGLVFLLWGSYAQKKGQYIDRQRHLVLTAPHPSPLSAHRGFFGCKHFSKANEYLASRQQAPVDWGLPD